MADKLTAERRSANMAKIRSRDTKPEMIVRRLLHGFGYRYRLHRSELPGQPDIVFPSRRAVIFVHGCYWHGHGCRRGGTGAKSNQEYWGPKIKRNRARDAANLAALAREGWRALVLWECEVVDSAAIIARVRGFLDASARLADRKDEHGS